MRSFVSLIAIAAALGGIGYLSFMHRVEAGYVGIKVDLLGSNKGVQAEEVGPGRYFVGINQELHRFPTFSQNATFEKENGLTFNSVEGMTVGADVGLTYYFDGTQVSDLFQRYRKGVDEITNVVLKNMLRDALQRETSAMKVNAIYGEGKAALMDRAQASVAAQVAPYGIIVEKAYWINSLRLPEQVVAAIDAEISANSRARQRDNEIAESIAEAKKVREIALGQAEAKKTAADADAYEITARATAQAAANAKLAASVTPELTEYLQIERWDGKMPVYTGAPSPLVTIPGIGQ